MSNKYKIMWGGIKNTILPKMLDDDEESVELVAKFENNSMGDDLTFFWEFGDGNTSTTKDPIHHYALEGVYTVKLTATNAAGSDTKEFEMDSAILEPIIVMNWNPPDDLTDNDLGYIWDDPDGEAHFWMGVEDQWNPPVIPPEGD